MMKLPSPSGNPTMVLSNTTTHPSCQRPRNARDCQRPCNAGSLLQVLQRRKLATGCSNGRWKPLPPSSNPGLQKFLIDWHRIQESCKRDTQTLEAHLVVLQELQEDLVAAAARVHDDGKPCLVWIVCEQLQTGQRGRTGAADYRHAPSKSQPPGRAQRMTGMRV
eukprot:363422-Chlamydomonas_euryale.AAC.6